MIGDRRGSAVLLVIWMTGVLAVLALTFAGHVREASQEVGSIEAHLRADAAIDGAFAQMMYEQIKSNQDQAAADSQAASADATGQGGIDATGAGLGKAAEPSRSAGTLPAATPVATNDGQESQATADGSDPSAPQDLASPGLNDQAQAAEQTVTLVQKPITNTVVVDGVSLYLHAEPEMGRIDVNRGDPRVLRALLEKVLDRATATEAMDATEKGKKLAERAGAVIGNQPLPFVTVDAWLAATGMAEAAAVKVRPYLTTFTGAKAVDLLYAPQEVIDVLPFLSRSQKDRIRKARKGPPSELTRVIAEIAADPSTDTGNGDGTATGNGTGLADGGDPGNQASGETARPVLRVTVEATVPGVLRKSEEIVLAFTESGSGGGAISALDEPDAAGGLGSFGKPKEQAAPPPLPFDILDRRILDTAPSQVPAADAAADTP